ncbi:transposase [Undibacterium nitidum]|uniref:transposase n=1 Tax=Undibacterium TaxID=401469 RepID=UPI002E305485|nr:transposase [Undibacterium nitidum]
MHYLTCYARGRLLHDGQIRLTHQHVNFTYTPHGDSATSYRSVCPAHTPERFLKLVLQLVPEPGKHTVRSFGLYAPRKTARLNLVRTVFRQAPITKIEPLTWQTHYAKHVTQPTAHVCTLCGATIGHVRNIAPHHDPPRPRLHEDRHVQRDGCVSTSIFSTSFP